MVRSGINSRTRGFFKQAPLSSDGDFMGCAEYISWEESQMDSENSACFHDGSLTETRCECGARLIPRFSPVKGRGKSWPVLETTRRGRREAVSSSPYRSLHL